MNTTRPRHPGGSPMFRWMLLAAFLLATGSVSFAQGTLITLGTGTSVTGTTESSPVNIYYRSTRAQFVYTASELNTALSPLTGARDLVKIGWYIAGAPLYPMPNYTIKMKHTSASNAGSHDSGPFTTVLSMPLYTPTSGGWDTLDLCTPFEWNGTDNILVDICWDQVNPTYDASGQVRYYSTTSGYRYVWSDGAPMCANTTGTTTSSKPQATMRWIPKSNMVYQSSTVTQASTELVTVSSTNQAILGIKVEAYGTQSPMSATSFSLSTAGSTSAADIANAKVYYTGCTDQFSAVNQFGSTVSSPSGSFTVTGTQALNHGENWFWLVYDIASTATVGNVVDGQCTSVTVGGTARTPTVSSPAGSRPIEAPMSGIYTIDATGTGNRNFTTFAAALQKLQLVGVSGATTFQVGAGTYNERMTIPAIAGASSTNTITFDGGTGNAATRILSYNTSGTYDYVVQLNGADYFRFRNMTIAGTNGTYGIALWFTGGADYNIISDCILSVSTNTTYYYSMVIVGSGNAQYPYYNGHWGNYNVIENNEIKGGYHNAYLYGQAGSTTQSYGNKMLGNTMTDAYYYGIYSWYLSNFEFSGNTLTLRQNATGGSLVSSYGVYAYYPSYGWKITKNKIKAGYSGLFLNYINTYNTTGTRAQIINNMVVTDYNTTNYPMYDYYGRNVDIWFNSFNALTNSTSYGMYLYGSSGYGKDVRNNYSVYSGTGTGYMMYNNSSAVFTAFDYNAFWTETTSATSNRFYYNGAMYNSWAALPKTVHNSNSVYGEPYFISETDLHSRSHAGFQAGQTILAVTDDIDANTRVTGFPPCIGADEYPTPPNEYDMEMTGLRFENAADKFAHVADPATHEVTVSVQNIGLKQNPTSLTVVYKLGSQPIDNTDGVAETFTTSWDAFDKSVLTFSQPITGLTEGSMQTVYATVFFTNEEDPTNDTKFSTHEIFGPKVHGFETFEDMAAMVHPPTYDPGYIESDWDVIDNNGGETLLIRSTDPGSGPRMEVTMYSTTETADEWLISPGAQLIAGSSYRVGFDFHNWGGSPVTIECAFGSSPNPASMTTYATFSNIAPGTTLTAKDLAGGIDPYFNTPNFHQAYYLGFRFVTSGTFPYFSLDNVKLDDNPSPPPKIGYGLPGDPITNFINDPAVPIIMVANYKQPGVINKTFAVANTIDIYGAAGDFLWDVETSTPWLSITKAVPDPTLQNYNLNPPRPRQFQTFTLSADPAGLPAGVHHGEITFYAILFNNDFPPPNNGLVATNEPFVVPVELRISTAGTKGGATSMTASKAGPLTVPGSPYIFTDPLSGDPIATLHVTSGQIDAMTITCFPNQLPQNLMRMLYVQRYWQISHTGTGWTADITFPYADHEASMILDRYQLRGVRQAVPLAAWEDPIMGTTSTSQPMTNEVSVRGLNPSNIGGNLALAHPYMIASKDGAASVETFGLEQNYPNPFNPSTTIRYAVAEERHVRIAVYNSLGLEVAVPVDGVLPAGRFEVSFDARNLPSGTYVYRMTAGDFVQTRQMTLSK